MRVLLIDDHALFREGLSGLLVRRGIEVIAAVGEWREGLRLAHESSPDIILLDLRMPGIDGLDLLRTLREQAVRAPIVMVTTSQDEQDLVAALRHGAHGYLLKDIEPDELVAALQQVLNGETVVARQLTGTLARVVGSAQSIAPPTPLAELTPREREILRHLAEGRSNKAIARALSITDGTVKLHVKSILRKLHVNSRVEAAVMAVEQGVTRNPTQRH